jgi:cytidylate kinase
MDMNKQIIISISREYGSGGHELAERLAGIFDLPLYDSGLLKKVLEERNQDSGEYEKYDEKPRNPLLSRTVMGYSNSPEEHVANLEFDYIRAKAKSGESFIVVGRCSDSILKDFDCLVTLFIRGEMASKIERIRTIYKLTAKEAEDTIRRKDKMRKMYHNYYCQEKWGDSRNYDLCINSSILGVEGTTTVLENFIRQSQAVED